jgi:hypothetical protein
MLCALSVRKLKPGAYDAFRAAWEPDEFPPPLQRAYHLRDLDDPDVVISFGFLDAGPADIAAYRADVADVESRRQAAMATHVDEVIVDGFYDVAEVGLPPGRKG